MYETERWLVMGEKGEITIEVSPLTEDRYRWVNGTMIEREVSSFPGLYFRFDDEKAIRAIDLAQQDTRIGIANNAIPKERYFYRKPFRARQRQSA